MKTNCSRGPPTSGGGTGGGGRLPQPTCGGRWVPVPNKCNVSAKRTARRLSCRVDRWDSRGVCSDRNRQWRA
eukprot:4190457-Pyramimonas_sp.AAC.1